MRCNCRKKNCWHAFCSDHPSLKGIKEQIAAATRTLNEEEALKKITVGLNQSRREMESALLNQQAVAAR